MPGKAKDTGHSYALDYWTNPDREGEPEYDFWDDLSEMRAEAERVVGSGRFVEAALHRRGPGPLGWEEFETVKA